MSDTSASPLSLPVTIAIIYPVSALASFLLSTGAVWVATAILGIDYKVALIALAIIVPVCNYLVNRFWVFLQPGGGPGRPFEIVTAE
jgi:hypothetical protein